MTLTIQLAGARTAAGNEHFVAQGQEKSRFLNLDLTVGVNGKRVDAWSILYTASSSCAVRSGVQCYNSRKKFTFESNLLKDGQNVLTLSLPDHAVATAFKAKLPGLLYVQYDALRLEIQ